MSGNTVRDAADHSRPGGQTSWIIGKMSVQVCPFAHLVNQATSLTKSPQTSSEMGKIPSANHMQQSTQIAARVAQHHPKLRSKDPRRFAERPFRQIDHRRLHTSISAVSLFSRRALQ